MATFTCLLVLLTLVAVAQEPDAAVPSSDPETIQLVPNTDDRAITQVTVKYAVGGELKVQSGGQIDALKMSVVGDFEFAERRLVGESGGPPHRRSVRQYDRAEAVIKVESTTTQPTLGPDRRLIAQELIPGQAILFCPMGPLTRDELDLIDLPAGTLVLDRLLPAEPVKLGESWKPADDVLAALVNLDAVSVADVQVLLSSATPDAALCDLAGTIHGAVEGVATEIELKGKLRFDRKAARLTACVLTIKERRAIGHVGPGMDVSARIEVSIAPGGDRPELDDPALADLNLAATPETTRLTYLSPTGEYQFEHDRRWHVVAEDDIQTTLRMVDRGDLIAQCNVASTQTSGTNEPITLAHFQSDIERALGKNFGRFVEASQRATDNGLLSYRAIAVGEVSELPIQWNYHFASDKPGRQVVFVFTIEGGLVESLGDDDQQIAGSISFPAPTGDSTAQAEQGPMVR